MGARDRLERYLDRLRRRLRTHIYARAAAVAALTLLVVTALLVRQLQRDGFPYELALLGRIALALAMVAIAVALVWVPLSKLHRKQGAAELERRLPAQSGRIETYLDARRREGTLGASPLVDLLAGDAVALTEATPVRTIVPGSRIWSFAAAGIVAAAVLAYLLIAGPAHWGYGSRYLLLGAQLPRAAVPLRQIVVTPGDATVRRNSDLLIRAAIEGFSPEKAQVFVRFGDEQRWQRAAMRPIEKDGKLWEFRLYALRGPLRYYVAAQSPRNAERSTEHGVAVVDLPRIERVRLTYRYPDWTGLTPRVDEASRDIRAVAETQVQLEVFADAPLQSPVIVVDRDALAMQKSGSATRGRIDVRRPGSYHIAARVANELVALTEDYRIEVVADRKPSIEIHKPGRDYRATNIEEVPVRIQAQDDFRLQRVELHYSVNGGDWRTLQVPGGGKLTDAESLLRLEELGAGPAAGNDRKPLLAPGDLVSYYAVAKDRRQAAQTDLFMVQVQPFERRFMQSQGGGGSGMGGEQGAISERQREILLATWNLQRNDEKNARSRSQLEDSARMLAELQTTLAAQTRTLAERMRARTVENQDERIDQFVESLERAAKAMDPAAQQLNRFDLGGAVPMEQQALQQLLRAESAFRDVQVAMQRDGSANGSEQAQRNFTEMFELEMDVDKNHYETQSQLAQRNDREELDEAIRKLKELAQRQEKLAQQQNPAQSQREQRWQQEQLRREAQDLQRRLAELQRSDPSDNPSAASQSPSGGSSQQRSSQERGSEERSSQEQSSQQQSSQQQGGQQQSQEHRLGEALDSMRQALEQMRAANGEADNNSANRSAREAGRSLRQALQRMDQPGMEGLAQTLEQLARRTRQLSEEQRRVEAELYRTLAESRESAQRRAQLESRRGQSLVEAKQKMADEVRAVQQQMRSAMNDHRGDRPKASRRLGEALSELENANLEYRINRSASEIRYGRARETAPREGLIAEALEILERDLRAAADTAAKEAGNEAGPATTEALLAEVGRLRRGLGAAPFSPEAAAIADRIQGLVNRLNGAQLSAAQISALRRLTHELKYLAGDPLASQQEAMVKVVDQIELATLAAAEKSRDATAAHTSASGTDRPQYREAIAEYYRRLGTGCANDEAGSC